MYDSREAAVGLSAGVFGALAAMMALWLVSGVVWWPVVHLVTVIVSWIFAWRVAVRCRRDGAARAVLYGGVPVVIGGILGVLAVFVRVNN